MVARKKHINGRRRRRIWKWAVLLILLLLLLELRLKPVAVSVSETQAKAMTTEIVNRSVCEVLEETGITCEQLEHISYGEGGKIAAVSSDAVLTNKLKNAVTLRIQEELQQVTSRRVNIPLGTLLGSELTNGQGPSVPYYITLSGNVKSDFSAEFESGGLNQTVHKLSLNISVELTILMPLSTATAVVETSVLIGETLINGDVPAGMIMDRES